MQRVGLLCAALLLVAGCNSDPVAGDIESLKGADAAGRKAAAERLSSQEDPRVAPALAKALRDADQGVRCAAAKGLGQQDPGVAVEPLATFLTSRGMGHECAYAPLGELKAARAAAPLLAAPRNEQALAALASLGPAAITPLVGALRREADARRAEELAHALAKAGGRAAVPALLELITEYDRNANANAATALGLIGDAQALPALVKAADAGIGPATVALARIGEPGLQALLARLDHPRPWQRDLAVAALAQARDPAVVALLERGLQDASPNIADGCARVLALLAGLVPPPAGVSIDPALKGPATAALDRAAANGNSRALAATIDAYLRQPDGEDQLIDMLEMHGDERLASAFLRTTSTRLHAAAVEWSRQTGKRVCADPAGCEVVPTDNP